LIRNLYTLEHYGKYLQLPTRLLEGLKRLCIVRIHALYGRERIGFRDLVMRRTWTRRFTEKPVTAIEQRLRIVRIRALYRRERIGFKDPMVRRAWTRSFMEALVPTIEQVPPLLFAA
jgi:hypothetical protein